LIKYFIKSFVPFASGQKEAQVFVENGKSSPSCANALLDLDVPEKYFGNILKKSTNRPDTGELYGY